MPPLSVINEEASEELENEMSSEAKSISEIDIKVEQEKNDT